jgi:hypothetical protein
VPNSDFFLKLTGVAGEDDLEGLALDAVLRGQSAQAAGDARLLVAGGHCDHGTQAHAPRAPGAPVRAPTPRRGRGLAARCPAADLGQRSLSLPRGSGGLDRDRRCDRVNAQHYSASFPDARRAGLLGCMESRATLATASRAA